MADPYATCSVCDYVFSEPDIDERGNRVKCPSCGELIGIDIREKGVVLATRNPEDIDVSAPDAGGE